MKRIDDALFAKDMKSLIGEIKQNNEDINNKIDDAIKDFKLEFDDVEKLFVSRCLKTLNEKLKAYKEREIGYGDLQGWRKCIRFDIGKWPEYLAYRKFFESRCYINTKALNESMRTSFRKYGLEKGGANRSEYNGEETFEYDMYDMYPGIEYKINK